MKISATILAVAVLCCFLTGCAALRSLTTRGIDFEYEVTSPPTIQAPSPGFVDTIRVSTQVRISGELVSRYDRYNGHIGWTALGYEASLEQGDSMTVKLWASLESPIIPGSDVLPSDAMLIEEITLTSEESTVVNIAESQNANENLKNLLEAALGNTSDDFTVYLYFETLPTGGRLVFSNLSLKGRAYGSLF